MKVEEGAVVSLIYKVKDEDGQVIDDNREASPLEYLHGHGNIISGLEGALDGVEKGERLEVTVEPEEAYGQPNPEAVFGMPRDRFPDDMDVEAGMQFAAETPEGPATLTVVEVGEEEVTVDANHPLAGKKLSFEVEVAGVRTATEGELNQQRPAPAE